MSAVFPLEDDPRWREHIATAGQTVFPVPYPFQDNADILIQKITLDGSTADLAEPEHYALTGAGNPAGGSYTLTAPAAAGEIYRSIGDAVGNRVQSVVRAGRYSSAATDGDLDRALIRDLEMKRDLSRTFKAGYGEQPGRIALLPEGHFHKADRHGNLVDGGTVEDIQHAQENAASAREDAERAETARDIAEEMAGSVQFPVSYGIEQTLLAAQRLQAQANIGPVRFDTVSNLLANTILGYTPGAGRVATPAGKQVEAQGFRYEIAAAGAVDHHVETAGGVKLYVLPNGDRMHAAAFGLLGNGGDETARLQKLFAAGVGYEIRLSRGKHYRSTEELVLGDDTSLDLRGSVIDFAAVGAKRNLSIAGDNVTVRGGTVRNIVGTPGQQGTYQTPIVIKRYDFLAGARNVTVENMTVETVTPMGPGIGVFGNSSGVTLRNLSFPDSPYMGTAITVHWSFNGDWQTNPPKTTVHQRNIVIENISIGEMSYNPGTPVNFNICGIYLSAVYNARVSNVTVNSIQHGSAVTVYAGDWGFQYAGDLERLFGSSGVTIDNVQGTACRGLSVYMQNTLDPPLTPWPMAVVASNIHVKGVPSNPESRGIMLDAAQNVTVRSSAFDRFDVGVGFGGSLRNVILDNIEIRNSSRWGLNTNNAAALGTGLIIRNSLFVDNNQSETENVADMTLQRLQDVVLDGNKFNSPKCAYNIRALNTASGLKVRNNHSDGAAVLCYSLGSQTDFGVVDEYRYNTASVTPSAGVRGGQIWVPIQSFTKNGTSGLMNRVYTGPGIPSLGTYVAGDVVIFDNVAAGGAACEAVCRAAGTPGTWSVTKQAGPVGGIGNAPAFVGQIAVASGVAHIATGTVSPSDWKQITN